jgi:AraC-like DNA-binding protein
VGTRKVYWNRIILTQANPVVKTSAIVLIVGGVLMMAFAFILYLNFKKGGEHRVGGLKKWQISPAFIERIKIKLQKAMVEDEIYMNEDIRYDESKFTLDYLAGAINEKKYLVSLVLNLEYKNFNDFANRYKIEKVKMMLTDPEFEHYSIEGIGQEVGFKSSSTFYKAFKNYTGITPQ